MTFDPANFTVTPEKQTATSKILATPFLTNFLAVYWPRLPDFDYDYNFLIRSSTDGKRWSRWKDLFLMAEGSDSETEPRDPSRAPPDSYDYSQLVYTKGAKFFQFKIVRVNFSMIHFSDFHFVFIDSLSPLTFPAMQKKGEGDSKKPLFVTRKEWEAYESLAWSNERPIPLRKISHIFIHHSALDNTLPHEVCDDAIRAYQLYHIKTKKWGDIGYHYLICQHGILYEGRKSSGSFAYKEIIGAHAKGFNAHSLGICLIGSYADSSLINQSEKNSLVRKMIEIGELRDDEDLYGSGLIPSKEVQNTIIAFLTWKAEQYRINPQGHSIYRAHGAESQDKTPRMLPNILGYQDVMTTLSPGQHLYKLIPSLRAAVAEKVRN